MVLNATGMLHSKPRHALSYVFYPFVTSLCEVYSACGVGLTVLSLSALGDKASSGTVFISGQTKLVCSVGRRQLMDYCG